MKLLRQREKEEERIRRQEEIMRAKVALRSEYVVPDPAVPGIFKLTLNNAQVDKLARKMQQETASLRASHPAIPLTQVSEQTPSSF